MDGWMDGIASIASMLAMGDRRARAGVPSTAFSVGAGSRVKGLKGLKGLMESQTFLGHPLDE